MVTRTPLLPLVAVNEPVAVKVMDRPLTIPTPLVPALARATHNEKTKAIVTINLRFNFNPLSACYVFFRQHPKR